MPRSRILRVAVGGLTVGVLLAGGLYGVDRWTGRKLRDVPVPAATASPSEVVSTYLRALNAHDCATAEALATGEFRKSARSWCRQVGSLKHVTVEPYQVDNQGTPDLQAYISVTFDLHWRPFHSDGSMENGSTIWGYDLVRASPRERWAIASEGVR